eukprot:7484816-Ditylum_brightwellii.AAC.1
MHYPFIKLHSNCNTSFSSSHAIGMSITKRLSQSKCHKAISWHNSFIIYIQAETETTMTD